MIKIDNYVNENKTEHNEKWPHIADHPNRILINGGSVLWMTFMRILMITIQAEEEKF